MDVYRQSAAIVKQIKEGHGTAKSLCLESQVQKKRATYAVVCESLRYFAVLEEVLKEAQFFEYFPDVEFYLALVLCFDAVVGRGVCSRRDPAAVAMHESSRFLRAAYEKVKHKHVIPPSAAERQLPRFARMNPLKGMSVDTIWTKLTTRKRAREEADANEQLQSAAKTFSRQNAPQDDEEEEAPIGGPLIPDRPQHAGGKNKHRQRGGTSAADTPIPVKDEHIPNVVMFPHGTDLHAHPLVKQGHLILQDKASCLPAAVLFDNVETVRYRAKKKDKPAKEPFVPPKLVVDGCAAPGNKTTHLAALGQPHDSKIIAVERDTSRADLLENRVKLLGAGEIVTVVRGDFSELDEEMKNNTEAILLDPSCSSSGVVSRADISAASAIATKAANSAPDEDAAAEVDENDEPKEQNEEAADAGPASGPSRSAKETRRIEMLARAQKKLLYAALTEFPNCRRVVYSTCSVNVEENEAVVVEMLKDEEIWYKWTLTDILPNTWKTRGIQRADENGNVVFPTARCLRCDTDVDQTSGFFVACFDANVV